MSPPRLSGSSRNLSVLMTVPTSALSDCSSGFEATTLTDSVVLPTSRVMFSRVVEPT
ncbi:MAG: hypothetical protein WD696_20450 [Bryobacteraceae bacterium]